MVFDSANGQTKTRIYCVKAKKMNKTHGKKDPLMQNTLALVSILTSV